MAIGDDVFDSGGFGDLPFDWQYAMTPYSPEFLSPDSGQDIYSLLASGQGDPSFFTDGLGGPGGTAPPRYSPPPPPDSPNKDLLTQIGTGFKNLLINNPGSVLSMGAGAALALMGFASSPGGQIRTPDGRTVQLSPQEQQFMNTLMSQAQQTAAIATPVNQQLELAAQRNAPEISSLMDQGLRNLVTQQGSQNRISDVVNRYLTSDADDLLTRDVAGGKQAGSNILDLLQAPKENEISNYWKNRLTSGMGVSPELLLEQEDTRREAEQRGLRTGGTGYDTTTWYRNQLDRLGREQEVSRDISRTQRGAEATNAYNQSLLANQNALDSMFNRATGTQPMGARTIGALQGVGQQGAATGAGLLSLLTGKDPTATATQGFGGLSSLGTSQAQNDLMAQIFNTQQANQNRNMLLSGGASLFGLGATRRSA